MENKGNKINDKNNDNIKIINENELNKEKNKIEIKNVNSKKIMKKEEQEDKKNNNSNNEEVLDIFKEIKQINNSKNDKIKRSSSSSSNEEEENIININNDNFNINNGIQINSEKNNHKSRKIEVIENYFDFHMHDIDLLQIESYYKT